MYSPKIRHDLIRRLYLLKHSLDKKKPMTQLVNDAVEKYLGEKTGGDEYDNSRANQTNNKDSCCSSESN